MLRALTLGKATRDGQWIAHLLEAPAVVFAAGLRCGGSRIHYS